MSTTLMTPLQRERAKRRNDVYIEYCTLAANPENSRTEIIKHLMKKFNIAAPSTVYAIIKEKEAHNESN